MRSPVIGSSAVLIFGVLAAPHCGPNDMPLTHSLAQDFLDDAVHIEHECDSPPCNNRASVPFPSYGIPWRCRDSAPNSEPSVRRGIFCRIMRPALLAETLPAITLLQTVVSPWTWQAPTLDDSGKHADSSNCPRLVLGSTEFPGRTRLSLKGW